MNTDDAEAGDIPDDKYDLHDVIREAKAAYEAPEIIHCPFFGGPVTLNADGFITSRTNRTVLRGMSANKSSNSGFLRRP